MTIYPAVDLRQGRVVRLRQGDPNQETVFGDDPVAVARRWLEAGARWLHVVNLDGALGEEGAQANLKALEGILALGAAVQFGGGLRSIADVEKALGMGVARAVLGTAAVENPALVEEAVRRFGAGRIVVALDARGGKVAVRGWKEASAFTPAELGLRMRELGVRRLLYTDVGRDGTLAGVNVEATVALARATGLKIIASGGVNSIEDIVRLKAYEADGIEGVVIGRALYEGRIDLQEALRVMS